MQNRPDEAFSTCGSTGATKYHAATGVNFGLQATTTPCDGQMRTVVTTNQSGTLDLRYAPRSPKLLDKNTAY